MDRIFHFNLFTELIARLQPQNQDWVQLELGVSLPRDARKRRTNNESDMECGDLSDLSPLSF